MSEPRLVGRVTSLRAFPVKSMDADPLARAQVLAAGVQHDRGWAVVDAEGAVVTAKQADVLRTVKASATDAGVSVTLPGADEPLVDSSRGLSDLLGRAVSVQASAGGYNEVAPLHLVSRQAISAAAGHQHDDGDCPCSVEEPRANLVLDLLGDELETAWVGARLAVGQAVLQVSKAPRHCLGVYAEVVQPGEVAGGDEVLLSR